jgi:hypothetical protein
MNEPQKRDVSISMGKANLYGTILALPVAIVQVAVFSFVHGVEAFEPKWNITLLIVLILAGIVVHEIIHGVSWAMFGQKPFSAIKFGFMWKTITPYAHIKEPLEVNAYRLGIFMPGLVLGIIPFMIALLTGSGDLMWFSLLHTTAACGDWLVLWVIRPVKPGSLVEDHPTNAGCYVLESA